MSSYDLSSLAPADALIALRSFPRRYRESLRPIGDDQVAELALRPGADGRSAVEIAIDTVRTWTIQEEALRQIRLADTPVVHPAVLDATQRHWDTAVAETLDDALGQIDDRSASLIAEVEHVGSTGWTRSATAAGGGSISALDLVRDTVRVGRDNLVAAEKVLASHRI